MYSASVTDPSNYPDHIGDTVALLLQRLLSARVDALGWAWLVEQQRRVSLGTESSLFSAFSAVPRYTGKNALSLSQADSTAAGAARRGWRPEYWSIDQAARVWLVLAFPSIAADAYVGTLDKLFGCADLGESIALYQSLPLLPHAQCHQIRAAEGVRSNMTGVFKAVALRNPYPADYFDDTAWNQMILKAVFNESPLSLVDGLDRRANPELARMLVDYAHERWAAGRTVSAELWRCVGSFAQDAEVNDLAKVLTHPDPMQQQAAALALAQSSSLVACHVLAARPDLQSSMVQGWLTWDSWAAAAYGKDNLTGNDGV